MRALLCRQWGTPEDLVLADLPELQAGETEAVVRVHAAGANFPDSLLIARKYQFQPTLPFSPGAEWAGVVEAVGAKVRNIKAGDRVMGFTGYGGFAEQLRCEARLLVPMPDDLEFVTAAAFLATYATACHALRDRAALKAGETLLVLGAAGGVGLAAVEVGKALGARVIAAASSADKLAVCREHGADDTINYSEEDLRERLRELTGGKGVNVICDPVGGPYTEAALRACAWRGRLLVVGFTAGDIPKIPVNLALLKGCAIVGVNWVTYAQREPMQLMLDLRSLLGWLKEGRLRPHVAARYPLAAAPEALRALMERRVTGKLVVLPQT